MTSQLYSYSSKIFLDLIGAASLILIMSPLLLATAALVKLDGGPVFYRHSRVGAGGRRFPCLKFRTMGQAGAAIPKHGFRVNALVETEWGATQTLRTDARITPLGAFLRQTNLDELPQLFNVLWLEMSLVGPRPIVESEIEHYGDEIAYYYATRPGLTGVWQVNDSSNMSYRERVQLDTWYVENWSLWRDIVILAKTVPAVLKPTGNR
jgi:lipopolysaccharide/colanic/teichoic acid biosynthesis glycosyltransferase